jgi:hypothetical protein
MAKIRQVRTKAMRRIEDNTYVRFRYLLERENYVAAARRLVDGNDLAKKVTKNELLRLTRGLFYDGVNGENQ